MSFATDFQELGTFLIEKFGSAVSVTNSSGENSGSENPSIGVITTISTSDLQDNALGNIQKSYVTYSDKVVFLKGTIQSEPSEGDVITFQNSGKKYTIIRVKYWRPDDIDKNTAAYRLVVRP